MATPPPAPSNAREPPSRRGWLLTGLILFAYVTTHLLNHAVGLLGLAAMDRARVDFTAFWQNPVGTVVLYGALLVHLLLALRSLYRRRSLLMRPRDALQLILGVAIVPLLAGHAIKMRLSEEMFGAVPSYARHVLTAWLHPTEAVTQMLLLLVAWTHGCLGIHFWLSLKDWYRRYAWALGALALLIPVCALLGYLEALRDVASMAARPGWVADTLAAVHEPAGPDAATLGWIVDGARAGLGLVLVLVLAARVWRNRYERRHRSVRVFYPGGRSVRAPIGSTLLEMSRQGNVAHASVCGGRGRCSTCRVRIVDGIDFLPPAGPEEAALLKRIGAAPDVRLACQLRPIDDLRVIPLLPAGATARDMAGTGDLIQGEEREICVLFADLRGFTRFAEAKLPYDVVFFLNRYFDAMGGAIERAGGVTNQFTGDGVMALFGLETGPERGCRDAFAAAAGMVRALQELSAGLREEMAEPFRIGIGIHTGPTVVGRMGRGVAMYLTAVGDTVHVASRLQDLTKQYGCQMVVSELTAARADIDLSAFPRQEIAVRNRAEPIALRAIDDVLALEAPVGG